MAAATDTPGAVPYGRYQLIRRIGRGGMGEVWLAVATGAAGVSRRVVIKRILPEGQSLGIHREAFQDEARLAMGIDHGNVVQVFDFGEVDAERYLAMEWVRGASLAEVLRECGTRGVRMPWPLSVHVVREVARGLNHAHQSRDTAGRLLGIVHRDVAPANVLVSFDGQVKVADFGIATATDLQGRTRSGVVKGRLPYLSPEQLTTGAVDSRTDIYACGVVLYELLTGRRPFAGAADAIRGQVLTGSWRPPSTHEPELPEELEAAVLRAMAHDPHDRHPTAEVLEAELGDWLHRFHPTLGAADLSMFVSWLFPEDADGPTGEVPAGYGETLAPWHRAAALPATARERNGAPRGGRSAVLLAALTGLGLVLAGGAWLLVRPERAPEPAATRAAQALEPTPIAGSVNDPAGAATDPAGAVTDPAGAVTDEPASAPAVDPGADRLPDAEPAPTPRRGRWTLDELRAAPVDSAAWKAGHLLGIEPVPLSFASVRMNPGMLPEVSLNPERSTTLRLFGPPADGESPELRLALRLHHADGRVETRFIEPGRHRLERGPSRLEYFRLGPNLTRDVAESGRRQEAWLQVRQRPHQKLLTIQPDPPIADRTIARGAHRGLLDPTLLQWPSVELMITHRYRVRVWVENDAGERVTAPAPLWWFGRFAVTPKNFLMSNLLRDVGPRWGPVTEGEAFDVRGISSLYVGMVTEETVSDSLWLATEIDDLGRSETQEAERVIGAHDPAATR